MDGVLLVGLHGDDHSLPRVLQAAGVPVQCIGRPLGAAGLPYVDADNVGGAAEAVAHLLRSGRKAVATIAGPQDMAVGTDRLAGYRRAVAGTQEIVAYGDFGAASGEHAMLRLLDRRPKLDAVFAASDAMAAGALRALRRLGVRVPGDIAVVGFDDAVVAQRTSPQLTTVRQAVEEMGARAASALVRREPTAPVVLGTRLVVRESA
ncbi:LacI family DNA-binding transcriptional regulator [Streptacidiphilus monticola]